MTDPVETLDALIEGDAVSGPVPSLLADLAALAAEVALVLNARALQEEERSRIYRRAVGLAEVPPTLRLVRLLPRVAAQHRAVAGAAGGAALAAVVGLAVLRGRGHHHGMAGAA